MFLAVDIGNSRVKCGFFDGSDLVLTFTMGADPGASIAAYRHSLNARLKTNRPLAGAVCSVVPALTETVVRAVRDEYMIVPTVISADLDLPLEVRYNPPESLGSDRLCAAVAAWARHGSGQQGDARPVVVIDAGTAVTFEVIVDGVYCGGAIAPGPTLQADALGSRTGRLPKVEAATPGSSIASETVGAIQSGIMFGFIDSVQGMIDRISLEVGSKPFVVATGGWSEFLSDHVEAIDIRNEHLVLEGIAMIAGALRATRDQG